jgi:hypothetical protein
MTTICRNSGVSAVSADAAIAELDPDAIAEALDVLAVMTGEARYSHAARLARGELIGGRNALDDGEELAMAREAVESGKWPTDRQACAAVARRISPPEKVRATTRRLYEKLQKK